MVLMGTNYGLYNQQPTHYFNNATYSRTGYNNNMSKNYYSGIEKTSSRAFFQYNYTPTPSQAYYQTNQPSMYSPPASPSSQHPPLHFVKSQTNCSSTTSSLTKTESIIIILKFVM